MKKLALYVEIDVNKATCGKKDEVCPFLTMFVDEWWCQLFNDSRGLKGAQKLPNRSNKCLKAEQGLPQEAGTP